MKQSVVMALGFIFSLKAYGAWVEVNLDSTHQKSPRELYEILVAHDDTCDKGCKYQMRGLKETIVIEDNGDSQYLWQRIAGIKETKQFMQNKVTFNDDGSVQFVSGYPPPEKIIELEDRIGQIQKTSFNSMTIDWQFTPGSEGTQINAKMTVDHKLPDLATPLVKQRMQASLADLFLNFDR